MKYRVLIESSIDIEAESEEAATKIALTQLDPDNFIVWEIHEPNPNQD